MDENYDVQSFDEQDTIPKELGDETEDIGQGEEFAVTPDSDDFAEENIVRDTDALKAQKSVSEKNAAEEPFISVQYNHKNRNFTKDEAVRFIQKGMHTEALRSKLEYLAKANGTDINSLVERIISAPEKQYRNQLERMYGRGSQEVEIGMKIYREKQSAEYKKIMSDSENSRAEQEEIKSVNSRLADEYLKLKAQMPDAPEYSKLPDSVIVEAAEGKRDLYSAYLCYLHKEKMKMDAAKKTQEAASAASSGKMSDGDSDVISSAERSFLSGLWGG